MNAIKRLFLILSIGALALPALAYNDTVTHKQMSIVAAQKSVLYTDPAVMFSLGLLQAQNQNFIYYNRSGDVRSGTALFTLSSFVAEGAVDEDAGQRALNHFFDPVYNRPLSVPIVGIPLGRTSWSWMLEESPISGQDNSLRDARDYLTRALTYTAGAPADAQSERGYAVSAMLLSLGHAMHHMEDMAQPQHVRNDQHYDQNSSMPFYNPSRYERYAKARNDMVFSGAQAAAPVYPGSADFKTARDFWFNAANTGIAQTVNHDFLSQGTNFTMLPVFGAVTGIYANPKPTGSTDFTAQQLFGSSMSAGLQTLCGSQGVDCTVTMYSTPVSQRASTYSIFDQDLRAKGVDVVYVHDLGTTYVSNRLFDLNRFNFDDALPVLANRAVSYASGIVNHFFRGRLSVNPPANGAYAVVDHAAGQGFTKFRTEVMNDTPDEALSGGTIRAIVRFHRNGCYKPDLTGEFQLSGGQLVEPCPNYRSPEEYVRVSNEQPVALGVNEFKQLTFTFSDPIPLDATDMMLEVYYTGAVGSEAESFALGATDISEPTFITIMNATDVFELSGAYYPWQDIIANIGVAPFSALDMDANHIYNSPPDVPVQGQDISYEIYVNGDKAADATIPEGRFARVVAIVEPTSFNLDLTARGADFTLRSSYTFQPRLFQYYFDRNQWQITPVSPLRHDAMNFTSVATHRYYPVDVAGVDAMPKTTVANSAVLIPVQITSQNRLGAAATTSLRAATSVMQNPSNVGAAVTAPAGPQTFRPNGPDAAPPVRAVPPRAKVPARVE